MLPRLGLLAQIGLALALVGTAPLVITAMQLAEVNREALVEQLLRTHTVSARTAADAIDGFLVARRSLAGTLLLSPELTADPTSELAQTRLRDSLASWSAAGVVAAALYDPADRLIVKVQQKGYGGLADTLLGGAAEAPSGLRTVDLHPWIRIEVPLTPDAADSSANPRPAKTGSLRLAVDGAPLLRTLAPDELGDQAQLLLLDRGGRALLGPETDVDNLPPSLLESALSARLSGSGRFRDRAGREIVGAWSAADSGRWIVVSTQPAAIAEAAALRMRKRTVLAVGLALALVAVISILAYRALVKPLRALLAAQRRVAGLSGEPARGSEVSQLKSTMLALERNARDRSALDQVFLGRYQVVEILGSGGMGTVFRGWDPRLQRAVALKTIHLERRASDADEKKAASRLGIEAVAAAQIVHPNVVAIYDTEEIGAMAYVAMEYVHGTGLDRYLEERAKLSWREVLPLGQAICEGLAAAHGRDLVHRDIKPGNILLGQDGSIKISDFGLAFFLSQRGEPGETVVGTPGFLAPEALRGRPVTALSDLFAVGVLLCRSLTGHYPFAGRNLRAIVASTLNDPVPPVESFDERIPRPLIDIVRALLEKSPERRLGPAREVAARFEELCRRHGLDWRLDFTRSTRAVEADEIFRSVSLPVVEE
ncbi:MAG: serine/threonine-protein kinase [Thermoanaerobaculia bacterium]